MEVVICCVLFGLTINFLKNIIKMIKKSFKKKFCSTTEIPICTLVIIKILLYFFALNTQEVRTYVERCWVNNFSCLVRSLPFFKLVTT